MCREWNAPSLAMKFTPQGLRGSLFLPFLRIEGRGLSILNRRTPTPCPVCIVIHLSVYCFKVTKNRFFRKLKRWYVLSNFFFAYSCIPLHIHTRIAYCTNIDTIRTLRHEIQSQNAETQYFQGFQRLAYSFKYKHIVIKAQQIQLFPKCNLSE